MSLFEETCKLSEPNCYTVFPVKLYTSLIYVKEESKAFLFVGPGGPFSCSKVAKIFYPYEG